MQAGRLDNVVLEFDNADDLYKAANNALPDARYRVGGTEWTTDNLGRTISVESSVLRDPAGRTKQHLQTAIGKEGEPDDVGFHLLADVFGAPINRLNVVPGNGVLNTGEYRAMEREIARLSEQFGEIQVRIRPEYLPDNSTARPDKFFVEYLDPETGRWKDKTFNNVNV